MSKFSQILNLLKDIIAGKEQDYTRGNINKAIFLLSVPMILEMIMESFFAVVDVYFVSKVSVDATATIGLTETVITIVYAVAMGISMAATAMIARRIGEKRPEAAARSAVQAIYIAFALSAVISVIGISLAEEVLSLMGASPEVVNTGAGYTRWMLGGNIVIMLLFLLNGIFRGAGDAFLAMRALWIANILNMILDPVFIFGLGPIPAMGIEGAAYATNLGRAIGVLYQLYHLFFGKGIIKISKPDFVPGKRIILSLLKIASGGAGQFLIASASWVVLMRIISVFGSDAIAGFTIGIRIALFTILPAWGLSNAAATLVGQNLGAKQPDRAEKSVWRTALFNVIFLGSVSIAYLAFAGDIVRIFNNEDAEVIHYGVQCLTFLSLGYIFYAVGMVVVQSFNGAGDTRTPTVLNFFGFWLIQIPLAYLLAVNADLGPKGVFLAIIIAESLMAVAAVIIFRMGKWKLVEV